MNIFDFTKTGGFPLTQDRLKFMQEATADMHKWFSYGDDLYTPGTGNQQHLILSGVQSDGVTGLTNGFVAIAGEVLPFVGDPAGGNQWLLVENKTNLPFFGDVLKDVQIERYVQQVSSGGTAMSAFKRFEVFWAERFGYMAVYGSWAGGIDGTLIISAGSSQGNAAGTITYRRNLLDRTLRLSATISFSSPSTISDPPLQSVLDTLPAGFRPLVNSPFQAHYRYHSTSAPLFADLAGNDLIKSLYCEVKTNGDVVMGIIKPDAGVTAYSVSFNHIIPLD